MHRAFVAFPATDPAALSLPSQMAQILVDNSGAEESVVAVLQRAGFTGVELATHMSEAVRLADAATRKVLQPDPTMLARHRALAGLVGNILAEVM